MRNPADNGPKHAGDAGKTALRKRPLEVVYRGREIRRGRSTFTVGTKQLSATAGQTVFVPAGTPHTFRTLAPDRYESLAIHVSPAFISTLLEAGNDFS